jgi:hypothetical protein
MSSPNAFIRWFRGELHGAGVRFAITSGQACVYYGIQQTTKDSDWIIEPDDLSRMRTMLVEADSAGKMRVSYRAICGAPLNRAFLGKGWTSHLLITDADSEGHRLDLFGKAPRVTELDRDAIEPDFASRQVVAEMKKTDREKDWPIVFALGRQAVAAGDVRGILHGQDADWLVATWSDIHSDDRSALIHRRPLLAFIDAQPHRLRRAIVIERQIWMSVNRVRYGIYQRSWNDFFRQWRHESDFGWPPEVSFHRQHELLALAAHKYGLPEAPLDDAARHDALAAARGDAAEILAASEEELDLIVPPLEVLLP